MIWMAPASEMNHPRPRTTGIIAIVAPVVVPPTMGDDLVLLDQTGREGARRVGVGAVVVADELQASGR